MGNPVKLMVREEDVPAAAALLKLTDNGELPAELSASSLLARFISKYGKIAGIVFFAAAIILLTLLFISAT